MNEEILDISKNENEEKSSHTILPSNCLALTVRKEYRLTITKHIFKKSLKLSIRVALSLLSLNFLNLFF